jgi:hypothetical protein
LRLIIVFLLFTLSYAAAFDDSSNSSGSVKPLARIGDRIISSNEFIQRSEFTVRPPYCKNNTYIQKKIILNSLIAEKYLALEAGEDNELTRDKDFQIYINGRKEQYMRQLFFYNEAFSKVELDSLELRKTFNVAGRKYKVRFFVVNSPHAADSTVRK